MQERDSKRYRNKGSRKTAVKTKLGTIEYSSRIYHDTAENKHIFLLDEAIFPQSVGLYDEVICRNIEEMICNQSFRETAKSISENTGLDISCQAVWNIVKSMGEKQIEEFNNAAPSGSVESILPSIPKHTKDFVHKFRMSRKTTKAYYRMVS